MKNGIFSALSALLVSCALLVASAAHAQTTVEYIHTDALGTPVAVTDATGTVIERSEYEPYGQLANRALTDGPGFTGHVQDAATGLTYMQQRYYDPLLGRFLSVDPVVVSPINGLNFNRYWYASNNPYKNTDPDGRCDGPSTCAIDRDIAAMNRGDMSREEFMDRSAARAAGAAGGLAILATRGAILRYLPVMVSSAARTDRLLDKIGDWTRTKGPTKIGERDGGLKQANKDFDKLKLDGVKDIKNKDGDVIGRTGRASDGRQVTVREQSTDGRPTLEVRRPNNRGEEIRYNEPK